MRNQLSLSVASVLAMLATPAFANGNVTYIDQNGTENSASISQPGDGNDAGAAAAVRRIQQNGQKNTLSVTQSGDDNELGSRLDGNNQPSSVGVDQLGDKNAATVRQLTDENIFNVIQQVDTSAGIASGPTNILIVDQQGGDRNFISQVRQTHDGSSAPANQATINQNGFRNAVGSGTLQGNLNDWRISVDGVIQNGVDNTIGITQAGDNNRIERLEQAGNGNKATVSLTGNRNGATTINATNATAVFGSGPAGAIGLAQSRILQTGSSNTVSYAAVGNLNLFGLVQTGDGNSATGTVTNNGNQLAVRQLGDGNMTAFVQSGAGNNAGIDVNGDRNTANALQTGASNVASIGITGSVQGDDNTAVIDQQGDLNSTSISVNGSGNDGSVTAIGNSNVTTLTQTGDGNDATVSLKGNSNGVGTFTGVALALDGLSTSLTQGSINQNSLSASSGNTVSYTVYGSSNLYAFAQIGGGNTITGSVGTSTVGSSSNQAAVLQVGNGNAATFTQIGGTNIAAISQ